MMNPADIFTSGPEMRYTKDKMTHAQWDVVIKEVLVRVQGKPDWATEIAEYVSKRTRKFAIYNAPNVCVGIQWSIPVEYLDPFEMELDAIALGDSPSSEVLVASRAQKTR